MKKIVFLLVTSVLMYACTARYEKELKELEETQLKLSSLKSTFEGVDMKAVNNARKTYKENMNQIKNYYQRDTIEMMFGNTLNRYKAIKKAASNLDQQQLNYTNDLKLMEIQLANLKADILNNSWEKDSIVSYLQYEKSKVEELGENIGTFVVNCDFIIGVHDSLADKVKEYTSLF